MRLFPKKNYNLNFTSVAAASTLSFSASFLSYSFCLPFTSLPALYLSTAFFILCFCFSAWQRRLSKVIHDFLNGVSLVEQQFLFVCWCDWCDSPFKVFHEYCSHCFKVFSLGAWHRLKCVRNRPLQTTQYFLLIPGPEPKLA